MLDSIFSMILKLLWFLAWNTLSLLYTSIVLPAKSDSDFLFCLQKYQGLIIDRSLVY